MVNLAYSSSFYLLRCDNLSQLVVWTLGMDPYVLDLIHTWIWSCLCFNFLPSYNWVDNAYVLSGNCSRHEFRGLEIALLHGFYPCTEGFSTLITEFASCFCFLHGIKARFTVLVLIWS